MRGGDGSGWERMGEDGRGWERNYWHCSEEEGEGEEVNNVQERKEGEEVGGILIALTRRGRGEEVGRERYLQCSGEEGEG